MDTLNRPRIHLLDRDRARVAALREKFVGLRLPALFGVLVRLGLDAIERDPTQLVSALTQHDGVGRG